MLIKKCHVFLIFIINVVLGKIITMIENIEELETSDIKSINIESTEEYINLNYA